MIVIPAIDIRNGRCVRLRQGDFTDETIYGDPVLMAKKWESEGARLLHIVDLDGAKSGQLANFDVIDQIIANVGIPVQVGGGIQSERVVTKVLKAGANKVVIGTLALEDESTLKRLIDQYSEQIIVSLDSKNGKLAKRGWLEDTTMDLVETAKALERLGAKQFIYTNVLKDGTLTQPDYQGIGTLLKSVKTPLIVAGGISSVADIKKLKKMGVEAVIVGKALYEGKVDLKEANNVS